MRYGELAPFKLIRQRGRDLYLNCLREFGFYAYALDGDKNKVLTVACRALPMVLHSASRAREQSGLWLSCGGGAPSRT
jgi:hypothetical protein